MKRFKDAFRSGRLLAVAGLFGIAVMAIIAVPMIASANQPGDNVPGPSALSVEDCQSRVAAENPRHDAFMDELVADDVISAEQAAEISSRLDERHLDACVARILFDRGSAVDATAEVTGTDKRDVIGAVIAGESLSQFANDHGVDDATLIDAIMTGPETKAAELVASGEISQADVENTLAKIEERVTEMIQVTDAPPHRFGGRPGPVEGADQL